MRRFALITFIMACAPMEPSGDVLAPVPVASEPTASGAPASSSAADFPFDEEDRPDAGNTQELVPSEDGGDEVLSVMAAQNVSRAEAESIVKQMKADRALATPPAVPAPQEQVVRVAALSPPTETQPPQIWDGGALPQASFGVVLDATITTTNPPSAVLTLPSGERVVLSAGDFIESERMVILAIGNNHIRVAKIIPEGFYARVETEDLRAPNTP